MLVREGRRRAGPCVWLFLCSVVCWGQAVRDVACRQVAVERSLRRSEGAGCSLVWWMPVSNDSEGRRADGSSLQFHQGAGRSEAEWEQVEEGLRTKEEGAGEY